MEAVIRTHKELRALRTRSARRGVARVVVDLPGDVEQRRRLESVLNRNLHACGCEMAAVFAVAGVIGLALQVDFVAARTLWAGAALAVMALTGKAMGLVIAEWRLRSAIDQFARAREESLS